MIGLVHDVWMDVPAYVVKSVYAHNCFCFFRYVCGDFYQTNVYTLSQLLIVNISLPDHKGMHANFIIIS